jgi:large subunit ribosomal protein L4e
LLNLNDSIPGITIKFVKNLSVLDFAPGSKPIRLSIFTQGAIDILNELHLPSNILLEK